MARSPSRRTDDRYYPQDRRDDRGHRRRSPSRDRDRHFSSRQPDRARYRDRSSERYDTYRSARRDGSRDRKRSREPSPLRDRRPPKDRYHEDRGHRDERDRKRARRDETPPKRSRRDDSRDRRKVPVGSGKESETQRPPATENPEVEKRKAKLARLEAWKEKKLQEKGVGSPASPHVNTHSSTNVSASPPVTPQAPASNDSPNDAQEQTLGYAGKFDPKAIAKRARAAMDKQKAALGGDVAIPKSATETSHVNGSNLADNSKVASTSLARSTHKTAKGDAKVSGFGLNTANTEKTEKANVTKATAGLDEEEAVERKLEKLPNMPVDEDAVPANDAGDQDDAVIGSDEEEAEAARETAQKRAEEARTEQQDVIMVDSADAAAAPVESKSVQMNGNPAEDDPDEEIDPLEAYMRSIEMPREVETPNMASRRNQKKEPQVFSIDDDDNPDSAGNGGGNDADDLLAIADHKKKKKQMPVVDHTKKEYEVFRKNFYSESVELSELAPEDVVALRVELDNITCRGAGAPKPITKWSQGGFGAQVLDVIREQKFEKPTSIQSQALPSIMSGRDVIGVAKTGSGKTLAFILPMLRHIKDQRPLEKMEGPIGLILAPTRELATQIHRDCKPYVRALHLRAVCAYGGAQIKDQIAELKRGAEIVVCTPGRMIDLLTANSGKVTNLARVTYVVLDEADRMFDMGFEPQISKILNNIRPQRQTVLFSATFPRSMEALARKSLTRPIEILVGGRSVVAAEITQMIEVRNEGTKFLRLLELLGELHSKDEDARSLVFVERQETADNMLKDLLRKGYPTVSIHGGREQMERDESIDDFKAGHVPVMIATSVAARGLDVKQLKLVVNFDCPNHIEDYVHRVGRTGRAGNTGTAVTFVTPEQDRFAPFLAKALTDSQQTVPEDLRHLVEAHEQKKKTGEAKAVSSGYGGKGIERYDAARDAERAFQRKQYKAGDEPEEEEEDEEKEGKRSQVEKLVAKATGTVKDRDAQQEPEVAADIIPTALSDHLNNAMKVQKAEPAAPRTGPAANDPLARVSAAAANINNRLGARGATRPGVPIDNRGPDAGAFHATLEINDFPQKARWAVTNRTNVAKILEATGTSITTKGNFYQKGQDPQPGGQPKLYILVEGDTEVVVETAMSELTRLLKEGTIAALDAESRAPTGGRYNVV